MNNQGAVSTANIVIHANTLVVDPITNVTTGEMILEINTALDKVKKMNQVAKKDHVMVIVSLTF